MSKVIEIKVPESISLKDEEIKRLMAEMVEEKLKERCVDINLYRLYFALEYPETKDRKFNFDKEMNLLKEMRKKEAERVG